MCKWMAYVRFKGVVYFLMFKGVVKGVIYYVLCVMFKGMVYILCLKGFLTFKGALYNSVLMCGVFTLTITSSLAVDTMRRNSYYDYSRRALLLSLPPCLPIISPFKRMHASPRTFQLVGRILRTHTHTLLSLYGISL